MDVKVFSGIKGKLIFSFLFILCFSCSIQKEKKEFYYPSDFDPNEATCFIWTDELYEIVPKLAAIISEKDKVKIFIGLNEEDFSNANILLRKYNSNFKNISFIRVKQLPKSSWARDIGPIYIINKSGNKKLVDFGYFGHRTAFSKEIAHMNKIPVIESSLNSSGGAREVNGKGTMILCETHELDVNKPKTISEIEKQYRESLGIKNFIWLKQGIPQDDSRLKGPLFEEIYPNGVNGHVDQFCRFANDRTILISSVTEEEAKKNPILLEAKKRLDENFKILSNSKDQNGRDFKIIKVPFADLLLINRQFGNSRIIVTPVTSYMNFIISNSYVILPSYISEKNNGIEIQKKEEEVFKIFKNTFPNREIIKMEATRINFFSGGFHCISINEPLITK